MNDLVAFSTPSITSQELADLVEKRHDNVKRTIETLVQRGVIRLPQIVFTETINNLGFKQKTKGYRFTQDHQRDTYVVVAQLSPELTARIVDRWQELERHVIEQIPKTLPDALRLAANLAERNEALENKIIDDAPKVAFAMAVRNSEGTISVGAMAKLIGMGRNTLFKRLRDDGVLMKGNIPYQKYIDRGYFRLVASDPIPTGFNKVRPINTPVVTGAGQVWIQNKYKELF